MERSIFILFICVVLVTMAREARSPKSIELVELRVLQHRIVDKKFTLFIPRSIQFEKQLVNGNDPSVVKMYVNELTFCYNKEDGTKFILSPDCDTSHFVDVNFGDEIEFDFSAANLWKVEEVVLHGERSV